MSALRVNEVFESVGLAPRKVDMAEAGLYLMPASIVAFADGEIAIPHEPLTGEMSELYGSHMFGDGAVTKALHRAAIENGMRPSVIEQFQRYTANYLLELMKRDGLITLGAFRSGVSIDGWTLTFDGISQELDRKPAMVIDYGPGLAGLSHTEKQVEMARGSKRPYQYIALSRLPFTNSVLMHSYDSHLYPGAWQQFVDAQFYLGREDGIASATDEMVYQQSAAVGTAEVADVVLASGIYGASVGEIQTGLHNAYRLLKQGGALVIRSLAAPREDEVGAEFMLDMAHDAGFDVRRTTRHNVTTGSIGNMLLSGGSQRQSISAVLRK